MKHLLDSAFLKLDRANAHVTELERQVHAAIDPKSHPVKTTITKKAYAKPSDALDPRPWRAYTISLGDDLPVLDESSGILLGEAIQGFRMSLDHLAWALVPPSHRRNSKVARRIQFPLATKPLDFKSEAARRLPGTTAQQQQLLEIYQPYKRTARGRTIRRLQLLSNTDKHRVVIPTLICFPEGDLEVIAHFGEFIGAPVQHRQDGEPIRAGAPLYTYVVAGPRSSMTVNSHITVRAALPRSVVRPMRGESAAPLLQTLRRTSRVCEEILNLFQQ